MVQVIPTYSQFLKMGTGREPEGSLNFFPKSLEMVVARIIVQNTANRAFSMSMRSMVVVVDGA